MVNSSLGFSCTPLSSHVMQGTVTANASLVQQIREQVAHLYAHNSSLPGAHDHALPESYIVSYYSKEIYTDVQHFIFKHFVLDYLMQQVREKKLLVSTWPRLSDVTLDKHTDTLSYQFTFSHAPEVTLKDWRNFVFNAPTRRNYKDLDVQVALFMKNEAQLYKKQNKELVEAHDWVLFSVQMLSKKTGKALKTPAQDYWMQISQHSLANALQELAVGRTVGDVFISESLPFVSNTQDNFDEPCAFQVTVSRVVKGQHFSQDFFKTAFKLRTKAEIAAKLIEVFSYRNDISQRRSMIEEMFHLMFTKHRFELPKHIVTRKKETLLQDIKQQPDYHVYKSHKDFHRHVEILAEKLAKEECIIDQIAYSDRIKLTNDDIASYLHLLSNHRLKEFVYFKPLVDNIEETDTPIHHNIVAQAALREKTLNHVISHLTEV